MHVLNVHMYSVQYLTGVQMAKAKSAAAAGTGTVLNLAATCEYYNITHIYIYVHRYILYVRMYTPNIYIQEIRLQSSLRATVQYCLRTVQ